MMQTFDTINEVVVSSFRRSLSYPLYRHWELSTAVFKDVLKVLKAGELCCETKSF
jgi:protein SHQ1